MFTHIFGDPDGKQDVVLSIHAAAVGGDACVADKLQAPIQDVEEQSHVLDDKRPPSGRRRGFQILQPLFDVLLRLGNVHPLPDDGPDGPQPLFVVL